MLLRRDLNYTMIKNENRLEYLDYLRVIACFSVIFVHVSAIGIVSYESGTFYHKGIIFLNRLLKYTTPVFLFLSGITSFYSYRIKEYRYMNFLRRRLKSVVVPFFIWSCIYYFILVYRGTYSFILIYFAKNLILGNMSYHLYFIPILLQMYFLSGLINFLFKKFDSSIILISSLVINVLSMEMSFLFSDRIFFKYIFFYILGVYFTKESYKFLNFSRKYIRPVFLIFIISTFIYSIFYYYSRYGLMNYAWIVFSISGIFFLFELSIKLDKNNGDNLKIRKLSKSTYYIYLMHPLILSGISSIFRLENFNTTFLLLIYFTATLIISTAFALGYREIKSRYLNQKKNRKRHVDMTS